MKRRVEGVPDARDLERLRARHGHRGLGNAARVVSCASAREDRAQRVRPAGSDRADPARRAQPPGAKDVRRHRTSGRATEAHADRTDREARPAKTMRPGEIRRRRAGEIRDLTPAEGNAGSRPSGRQPAPRRAAPSKNCRTATHRARRPPSCRRARGAVSAANRTCASPCATRYAASRGVSVGGMTLSSIPCSRNTGTVVAGDRSGESAAAPPRIST